MIHIAGVRDDPGVRRWLSSRARSGRLSASSSLAALVTALRCVDSAADISRKGGCAGEDKGVCGWVGAFGYKSRRRRAKDKRRVRERERVKEREGSQPQRQDYT